MLSFIERAPKVSIEYPPLLVLMHGRDAFAETIFSVEHLLPQEFHIVSVRASYKSSRAGYEWFKPYDYDHPIGSFSEEHFHESVELARETITSIIKQKHFEQSQLFLLGFSQGAAMCYFLGLEGAVHAKGVVPMSGFFPRPIERWPVLDTSASYLITHGNEDQVLPVSESLYGLEFLKRHGISADYHEYKGRHKMTVPLLKYVRDWLVQQSGVAV